MGAVINGKEDVIQKVRHDDSDSVIVGAALTSTIIDAYCAQQDFIKAGVELIHSATSN